MEWSVRRFFSMRTWTLVGLATLAFSLVIASLPAQADEGEDVAPQTGEADDAMPLANTIAEPVFDEVDDQDPQRATQQTAAARLIDLLGIEADPSSGARSMSDERDGEDTRDEGSGSHRDGGRDSGDDANDEADEGSDDGLDPVRSMAEVVPETLTRAQDETQAVTDDVARLLDDPVPTLFSGQGEPAPTTAMGPPAPTVRTQSAAPVAETDRTPLLAAGLLAAGGAAVTAAVAGGHAWTSRLLGLARRGAGALVALPLFSKIDRSAVLDHRLRAQVVDALRAEPGLTTQALRRRFDVGYSTLAHHVRILGQHGLVTDQREGRHRRLFLTGAVDRRARVQTALLANPATARVYAAVHRRPGRSLTALAEATGVRANTVHWHLGRLAQAGLVTKRRVGRQMAVDPAPGAPVPPTMA